MTDRKIIFDAVRGILGRGFEAREVRQLDAAIDAFIIRKGKGAEVQNAERFYEGIRSVTGGLDQVQVDSINSILKHAALLPMSHVAYLLATGWHEARLKPQREWGRGAGKPYGKNGKYGQPQYGRGLVQLTWDDNYERADDELGLGGTLLKDFDRALEPELAAQILVRGSAEGWFTGKRLADYIKTDYGTFPQFKAARRIINGTDRASDIADLAMRFQDALYEGKWA